jgi:hypothetical protein
MAPKTFQSIGLVSLIIGTCLLAFLGIISIWGDIEAFVFNAAIRSEKTLSTLNCPAVITPKDNAVVSARITNSSDRALEMLVRTNVSDGYVILMKEIFTTVNLNPGESETVSVPITVEDAAYDRFVLVRMHQIRRGSLPYLNASCGVIVFDAPFITGKNLTILILGFGTSLSVVGIWLFSLGQKRLSREQLITFRLLLGFTILSFLLSIIALTGWWLLGSLLAVVWILLGIGLLSQKALISKRKVP